MLLHQQSKIVTEFLDSSISIGYEVEICIDPLHVLVDILREGTVLEGLRVDKELDFGVILRYAVLKEEEVHIAFEIDEEVVEP